MVAQPVDSLYPGDDHLAHASKTYMEQANARLADKGLLAVAQGHDPAWVRCIIDIPLDDLPLLPHTHRDYDL